MQTIPLGQSGLQVPPLCLGTWAWGDQLFWGYGDSYGSAQVEAAFRLAVENGVAFFDTAEVYGFGLSEKLIGSFKQQVTQPIQIATKYGPAPWRIWSQAVAEALHESLNRLQVAQVELYQVHWPFAFLMSQETLMNALADAVDQGKVLAVGVSNYTASQMRQAHDLLRRRGVPLAVNQVRYSLLTRQIETDGILSTARELDITILAYSPLAQGLLTGKFSPENYQPPVGPRQWDARFKPEGLQKIAPLIQLLQQLGEKYDRTPTQVALNWLMAQGNVIPIAGVKNAEQVRQNLGALDWSLTPEDVQTLSNASTTVCI